MMPYEGQPFQNLIVEQSEKFILKLLTELENKKIIESKTIYRAKNMSEKILSIKNMKISIQIDVNKKPFEIIKFATNEYQISITYNTIRDLKTTNIQTNRINTTNSNLAVISKMINRKIYIDIEILSEIYREFIKENNTLHCIFSSTFTDDGMVEEIPLDKFNIPFKNIGTKLDQKSVKNIIIKTNKLFKK
jgi:hypothetical protein